MNHKNTEWNVSSRVHQLNHFPSEGVSCFVKRDDELSCGISGSKMRKYSSLMPYLSAKGVEQLIVIAGPQSNNLLAALQMAREYKLQVKAFLLKPWTKEIQGNYKLSRLFLQENDIVWIERKDWEGVEELAQDYVNQSQTSSFILSEGASVAQALPGALSLAKDIIHNEQALGFQFQHIFIDAGTGFSAAALIKGLDEHKHPAHIHVLLLADTQELFRKKVNQWISCEPDNYSCFYPPTAKAFGALNQTIKNEIKQMAQEEGILVDPVYSAKLFHAARKYISLGQIQGTVLIIHSGGALSLAGFEII